MTHEPAGDAFLAAWQATIGDSRSAHFAFRADFLAWEGARGRRARAVLAEEGSRRGALLLTPDGSGWACGHPWRMGALVPGVRNGVGPVDLTADDALWLYRQAVQLTRGARLRMYLPFEAPRGITCYFAGASIHQSLDANDAELLGSMSSSKRRMVRRAMERGYVVREAQGIDDLKAFHQLNIDAKRQRGERVDEDASLPEAGMSWREWELPWMWLLIVGREGRVESGAGDSIGPGWSLEARTAALSADARRDGAFALLCHEEARRARDRGFRWINHGGSTVFKREIAGTLGHRVPMWCWLAGDARWALPNQLEAAAARLRHHVASWRRGPAKSP